MKLEFKPLPSAPFLMNAVVQVNPRFNVSVTYNKEPGNWHVGDYGSFQCAIQVRRDADSPYRSLVAVEGNPQDNVFSECDLRKVDELVALAEAMEYSGEFEVFDVRDRSEFPDLQPRWGHWGFCAVGYDEQCKRAYLARVYNEENTVRFTPRIMVPL
jgi:hypothetical protein